MQKVKNGLKQVVYLGLVCFMVAAVAITNPALSAHGEYELISPLGELGEPIERE